MDIRQAGFPGIIPRRIRIILNLTTKYDRGKSSRVDPFADHTVGQEHNSIKMPGWKPSEATNDFKQSVRLSDDMIQSP
jgi:hypothetical protein